MFILPCYNLLTNNKSLEEWDDGASIGGVLHVMRVQKHAVNFCGLCCCVGNVVGPVQVLFPLEEQPAPHPSSTSLKLHSSVGLFLLIRQLKCCFRRKPRYSPYASSFISAIFFSLLESVIIIAYIYIVLTTCQAIFQGLHRHYYISFLKNPVREMKSWTYIL